LQQTPVLSEHRGMEPRIPYPTDLSEQAWDLSQHLVPEAKSGGRPAQYPKRAILNGIFYVLRGGCAWRLVPHDFPPGQMVYHDFWRGRPDGTWQVRHDWRRGDGRLATGKHRQPRAGSIESPSVNTTAKGGSTATRPTTTATAANAISASRPEGCCWPWWSRPPVGQTALGRCGAGMSSGTRVHASGCSGRIRPMAENASRGYGGYAPGGASAGTWSNGQRGPRASSCCRSAGWWSGPVGGGAATAA
jgi:transposase